MLKMFYAYEISYAKSHERAVKTIIKINDLKVCKLRINLLVLNYYSSPHCGFLSFKPKDNVFVCKIQMFVILLKLPLCQQQNKIFNEILIWFSCVFHCLEFCIFAV